MGQEVVPALDRLVEVAVLGVGQGPQLQEEPVAVVMGGPEGQVPVPGGGGAGPGLAEGGGEPERLGEEEGAVMVVVIAGEDIRHRGLGRDRLQGGVGPHQRGGGVEAGVGDAPDAHLAVMAGHVVQEPLDGVEGIRRLVHAAAVQVGRHLLEDAAAHHPAPHILVHDDEPVPGQLRRGAEVAGIGRGAVGADAVAGAVEQEGQGPLRDARGIDGREQFDAIAHGDAHLLLAVVGLHPGGALGGKDRGGREEQGQEAEGHGSTGSTRQEGWSGP